MIKEIKDVCKCFGLSGRRRYKDMRYCLQVAYKQKFQRYFTKMAKLWYKIMMEVKILKGNVNME